MNEPWIWHSRVRYYETDRMGVVHHSNYLRILEDARLDWLDAMGMNSPEMERSGVIVPCTAAQGEFLNFLRFGEPYQVAVTLEQYSGVRMRFSYEITSEATGKLCYRGTTDHCFVRDGDYLPISLKHKLPRHHQRMRQLTGQ